MTDPFIIAEAAQGYEGNLDIGRLLVKAAAVAQADAVKFQVVFVEELCEPGYEHYELFKSLEMSSGEWATLCADARSSGVAFLVDVFGQRSLEIASQLDVDGIKLHSTTFFESNLVHAALALEKPTYISVGGIEVGEIEEFIASHRLREHRDRVTLLFGFQAEPTPLDKTNLARIAELRTLAGLPVGFMDHTDGAGPDTIALSAMAMAVGVSVFEKHITLDRALQLEDWVSALAPREFADYVSSLRRLAVAVGSPSLDLTDDEVMYRGKALKRVIAARDLEAGRALTLDDLRMSRPAVAKGLFKPAEVVGRELRHAAKAGQTILAEDLE